MKENNSRIKVKQVSIDNYCISRAVRQAPIIFKDKFKKIGKAGKYLGMWKLKNCACTFFLYEHLQCLWKASTQRIKEENKNIRYYNYLL